MCFEDFEPIPRKDKVTDNPLESEIEGDTSKYAVKLGWLSFKFVSPSQRSVPDRLYVFAGNVVIFIEYKRKDEEPTVAQEKKIAAIRAKGVSVFVIDNIADGKELFDDLTAIYR